MAAAKKAYSIKCLACALIVRQSFAADSRNFENVFPSIRITLSFMYKIVAECSAHVKGLGRRIASQKIPRREMGGLESQNDAPQCAALGVEGIFLVGLTTARGRGIVLG